MAADLSAKVKQLVTDGRLPGTGVVALNKSGRRIYDSAFGTLNANEPNSAPFTNDTQMLFWSCTKFITSIAILQLLEQGKIASIDDPVSKYLPDQPKVEVITEIDADDKVHTRPPATEMTIIQLLTHTSGYTYDFWDQLMFDYRRINNQPHGAYGVLGAKWHFHDAFLEFDPGTRYNYGISIDFLGFIVEQLSGMSLPEYIAANITDPLEMTKTGTGFVDEQWLQVHLKSPEGKLTATDIVLAKEPYKFGGGHYLVSTVNDYSQILLTMLNEGTHPTTKKTILKPETVRDYVFKDFIPHVGCSSDGVGVIPESLAPGLSNGGELLKGQPKGWSCGLMVNLNDVSNGRHANSGAWCGLGNLYYWIDPEADKAGIVATSVLPFLDRDSLNIFAQLETLAYSS